MKENAYYQSGVLDDMRSLWPVMAVALLLFATPLSVNAAPLLPNEVGNAASYNYSQASPTTQTTKAVFGEVYTASWCVPCVEADEYMADLSANNSRSDLIMVSQYGDTSGDSNMATDDSKTRMNDYYNTLAGFPFAFWDGMNKVSGSAQSKLDQWDDNITIRSAMASNYAITLEGTVDNTTATYDVSVSQVVTEDEEPRLFVMLVEDKVEYQGTNGVPVHHYVVRMIDNVSLMDFTSGDFSATGSWAMDSGWNQSHMSVVALVQMDWYEVPEDPENGDDTNSAADGGIPGFELMFALVSLMLVALVLVGRRARNVPSSL